MRRVKLNDERGRVLAGFGGVIALLGAVVIAMTVLSLADRGSISAEHIVVVPEDAKSVSYCHKTSSDANPWNLQTTSYEGYRGHFTESGTPESGHEEDFLVRYTDADDVVHDEHPEVLEDDDCAGAPPTATAVPPTSTAPVGTSTAAITPDPTNTAVPPTSTPTVPVATSTAAITPEPTNTPTRTPTNTPVTQSTNTPVPTATRTTVVVPPTNTPVPLVAQVQSVQATPRPPVRALPSTGSGGYEDNSMSLILGIALVLTGSAVSLAAMKRRAS
jgi:hypothetical protein